MGVEIVSAANNRCSCLSEGGLSGTSQAMDDRVWRRTISVTVLPSIGSWSLPYQSHYFITKSRVVWTSKWTEKQIAKGRAKERYYAETQPLWLRRKR